MNIKISIENKHCTVLGTPVIVCGNSGYKINFTFDAEWEGGAVKTARFVYQKEGKYSYIDVSFSGSTVDVPYFSGVTSVLVGVYTDTMKTTTPAKIPCEYSIRCISGERQEETPGGHDQLLDFLITLGIAPVLLDSNGAMLVESDNTILINM